MDSILATEVVRLPREDQLRDRLGEAFVRLDAVPPGWVVVVRTQAAEQRHADADADVESAYARALLAPLGG